MTIKFKIATPEKVVFESEADQITLPTTMGEITVLPNHLPVVATLKAGELLLKNGKEETPLAISGGFVEFADNQMVILADTAERVEEINEERAEQGRQKAREIMEHKGATENIDYVSLAAKMEKELARLKVARKYKHLRKGPQIKIEE